MWHVILMWCVYIFFTLIPLYHAFSEMTEIQIKLVCLWALAFGRHCPKAAWHACSVPRMVPQEFRSLTSCAFVEERQKTVRRFRNMWNKAFCSISCLWEAASLPSIFSILLFLCLMVDEMWGLRRGLYRSSWSSQLSHKHIHTLWHSNLIYIQVLAGWWEQSGWWQGGVEKRLRSFIVSVRMKEGPLRAAPWHWLCVCGVVVIKHLTLL